MRQRKEIKYEIDKNGCHICTSHSRDTSGYPRIIIEGNKQEHLSRYIYKKNNGEIRIGLLVRHKCDNRACINPEHLELGTHSDNMKDKAERCRSYCGENHKSAKLNVLQVIEIFNSKLKNMELIKIYNVSDSTISSIRHGRYWKQITKNLNPCAAMPK